MLYALAAVDNVVRLDIISFYIAYFAMLQTAVRSPQPSRETEEIARIISAVVSENDADSMSMIRTLMVTYSACPLPHCDTLG
jgi:hypothetical protein